MIVPPARCFLCQQPISGKSQLVPFSDEVESMCPGAVFCEECDAILSSGTVALVTITAKSWDLQLRAMASYYERKHAGQKTPFPLMFARTGLTLFVQEGYIRDYFIRMIPTLGPAACSLLLRKSQVSRWMLVPDTMIEEEGLVNDMPLEVVETWRKERAIQEDM